MELICPTCTSGTSVPDDRLPPEGARARCHSCGEFSVYYRGGLVADDPTPPQGMLAINAHAMPEAGEAPHPLLMALPSIALSRAPVAEPPAPPPSVARGPGKSIGWQIRTAAGDSGPVALDALKPKIRDGSLLPDDLACPPGRDTWTRAGDLPDLQRWFALQKKAPKAGERAPGAAPDFAACTQHPGARGRWMCQDCGNLSCDTCVLTSEVMRVTVRQCPLCRKACTELVPTRRIIPFWQDMPAILRFPFADGGWIAMLLCWVVGTGAVVAGAGRPLSAARFIMTMSVYAYHLLLIRTASKGSRKIPNLGDIQDIWADLVWPGFRAAFVSVLVFLPPILIAAVWLFPANVVVTFAEARVESAKETRIAWEKWKEDDESGAHAQFQDRRESDPGEGAAPELPFNMPFGGLVGGAVDQVESEDPDKRKVTPEDEYWRFAGDDTDYAEEERKAQRDLGEAKSSRWTARIAWGFALGSSLFIWPIFLIIVALFNTVMPAFQPQVVMKLIKEIPEEYRKCAMITSACFLAVWILGWPLAHVPLFNSWQSSPLTYYFTFVAFHVMGRTAEMAEQKLDWH